jgi:hypothetical protein
MVERVLYTPRLADLRAPIDVIEAVTEDARIKGELFAELDAQLTDAQFRPRTPHRSASPSSPPRPSGPSARIAFSSPPCP